MGPQLSFYYRVGQLKFVGDHTNVLINVLILVTCLLEYENSDKALHSVRNHARDLRTVPADKLSQ